MNAAQFRSALERCGLSQAALARLIDREKGTVNRWAQDVAAVPPEVELLLLLLEHTDLTVADLQEIKAEAVRARP